MTVQLERRAPELDHLIRTAHEILRSRGHEPHPAEVAAFVFAKIERRPPFKREMLIRSALVRVVREVTSA